jgi:hypothetical protein
MLRLRDQPRLPLPATRVAGTCGGGRKPPRGAAPLQMNLRYAEVQIGEGETPHPPCDSCRRDLRWRPKAAPRRGSSPNRAPTPLCVRLLSSDSKPPYARAQIGEGEMPHPPCDSCRRDLRWRPKAAPRRGSSPNRAPTPLCVRLLSSDSKPPCARAQIGEAETPHPASGHPLHFRRKWRGTGGGQSHGAVSAS